MRRATAHLKDEPAKPPVAKADDAALETDIMWSADTPQVYLAIGAYSWGADEGMIAHCRFLCGSVDGTA